MSDTQKASEERLVEKLERMLEQMETKDGAYDSLRIEKKVDELLGAVNLRKSFVLIYGSDTYLCVIVGLLRNRGEEGVDRVHAKIEL